MPSCIDDARDLAIAVPDLTQDSRDFLPDSLRFGRLLSASSSKGILSSALNSESLEMHGAGFEEILVEPETEIGEYVYHGVSSRAHSSIG